MKNNLTEEQYQDWLKKAPQDHFSEEFIQFLRDNNEVIEENYYWLVIRNIKNSQDYTAFYIPRDDREYFSRFLMDLCQLRPYFDREWKIKAPHKRSVKLFHVHLISK